MRTKLFYYLTLGAGLLTACDDEPSGISATSGNITTVAGKGPTAFGHEGDGGKAIDAKIGWVTGIAVDEDQNVFITDGAGNTIRKITSSGTITTVAGTFLGFNVIDTTPYHGDGGPATEAHFNFPIQAAVDGSGNIFVADAGNNVIRMIKGSEDNIQRFAGKGPGFYDFDGDGMQATATGIWNPYGVAVDDAGNVYYADTQNNAVRMVTRSSGVITTIAGLGADQPGYSGDGSAANAARLSAPTGVAVDANGNIYIADGGNHRVRKVSNGIITLVGGTGAQGYSGDGGPATTARFSSIKGIAVDKNGNVFVADASNNAIRKIDGRTQVVTTLAGKGIAGYSGDGGPAANATLSNPWGVAVDKEGNVYIADSNNSAIRMVAK
jgi:sugar lactone lactonase YvrE